MGKDARSVVEGLMAAWWRQDVEATLSFFAESVFYTVHHSECGANGESRIVGKPQMRAHLSGVRDTWQFIYLAPTVLVTKGNNVRGQVLFLSVHRQTGLRYSGTKRFEWRVDNGLVTKCAKFHDADGLRAFLAMAQAT